MANRRSLALRRNDVNAPLRPGAVYERAHLNPAIGTIKVPYVAGTGVTVVADPPEAATYWRVVGANAEIGINPAGVRYPDRIYSFALTQTPAGPCTDVLAEPFNNFTTNGWDDGGLPCSIVAGRNGTCMQATGPSRESYTIAAPARSDTLTIGFAWRRTDALTTIHHIAQFWNGVDAIAHNRLAYTPSTSTLEVQRGGLSIASATSITLTQNVWAFIEMQVKLHDSTGFVKVRVNGVEVINATGLDTKNGGTQVVYDYIRLCPETASTTGQWDDLYLTSGSGCGFKGDPNPNDVLGEPFNNVTAWTVGGTPEIVAGRTGSAVRFSYNSDQLRYNLATPNQSDTLTVGFAWKWTDTNNQQKEIVDFNSDAGATVHTRLVHNPVGNWLAVYRGTSNQVGFAASIGFAINTWYYIEMQAKLHDTAGFAIVRVNGTTVINSTAIDTKEGGTKTVYDQIHLRHADFGPVVLYDDLYLSAGSGAAFKGAITIP